MGEVGNGTHHGTPTDVRQRIFVVGDLHGDYRRLIAAVRQHRPLAVLSVGDLEPARSLEVELAALGSGVAFWWIPGNHDTDSEANHDHLFGSALADRNYHGRVVTIAAIRIAGLGGVFRGQVWQPPGEAQYASSQVFLARTGAAKRWRGAQPLRHRSTNVPGAYDRLARERADVLITHEAPSCHPFGYQAIDLLAVALGVKAMFHGHHHDRLDYTQAAQRLGFAVHGVGLRGITDLAGNVIVNGERDAERDAERAARRQAW